MARHDEIVKSVCQEFCVTLEEMRTLPPAVNQPHTRAKRKLCRQLYELGPPYSSVWIANYLRYKTHHAVLHHAQRLSNYYQPKKKVPEKTDDA